NTDLGGVAVYACGPESLLAELEDIVTARGGLFRAERFAPRALDEEDAVETAFEVELAESGGVVRVDPGETILSAMEAAGYAPPYSCREGTCGTCETRIVDGAAHHRDSILTPEERAANEYMMICVSRAATERLILEL